MKACCPARIGALVGISIALLYNIALAAFIWSGFSGFNPRRPTVLFCSYDENVTTAYREPSVCARA